MITASFGNTDLLKLTKTAFLCSRKIPASVVLKCYDWAKEQREQGNFLPLLVFSTNRSIELLVGNTNKG